ncbi:hypothetical protein ACWFNE_06790 [Cellulomonas sp. NPDC055163]
MATIPETIHATTSHAPGVRAEDAATVLEATSLDGFTALRPVDGLFLRAEHLAVMQGYTRSLTRALATATGPGVVHGLRTWLDGGTLVVENGLAISPDGTLLPLADGPVKIDLAPLTHPTGAGVWRVELHPATGTSGPAPVYDSMCGDGCGRGCGCSGGSDGAGSAGGSSRDQWKHEGVVVRVVAHDMPAVVSVPVSQKRNVVASTYFENERVGVPPWLLPAGAGKEVAALLSQQHPWDDGTALQAGSGVPLALLVDLGGRKEVDEWAARRLVDGAAAQGTWLGRLGMRPWSVFLAQILQFEQELLEEFGPGATALAVSTAEQLHADLTDVLAIQPKVGSLGRQAILGRVGQHLEELLASSEFSTTRKGRLVEIAPAGYLPYVARTWDDDVVRAAVTALLGQALDLRIRHMRVDQVAGEIVAAQHRDRIPLLDGRSWPKLDILVPSERVDRPHIEADPYGWIAFVRRGPEPDPVVEPTLEDVDVYVYRPKDEDGFDQGGHGKNTDLVKAILAADPPEGRVGRVTYPTGAWAYPGAAGDALATRIAREILPAGLGEIALIAVAPDDTTLGLASTRAFLFGASLDAGTSGLPVTALADPTAKGARAIIVRVTVPT